MYVAVTFVSNNGEPITNLSVSALASLPSGWSGPGSFSCSTVTTGSGCVLNLNYAPIAAGSGKLTLNYSFTNALGVAMSNTVSVAYSATTHDNVVATAAPTGQINAVAGSGSQGVTVTFTTDDGQPASSLILTSPLSALPAGWSSTASRLSCASVSNGNGCQLALTYAPQAAGRGTLTLTYAYTDNAGGAKTGAVTMPYSATTNDNVVATAAPTGQIDAVAGSGSQGVTINFTTDDGQPASDLTLTSLLSALPAGWTSTATSLSCAAVSTGNSCQLALTYAPQAAGSGSLTLAYAYADNAGGAKTGSVNVPYAATTHDHVVGVVSPSGQVTAAAGGGGTTVTVTFATDDGYPASQLSISAGLSSLPSGWSGPGTFSCNTVSAGTACQLSLTYAPQYTGAALTLTLSYSYMDNAANSTTGTVNISYAATGPHLYITNLVTQLDVCNLGAGGLLATCAQTPASGGVAEPAGIAFSGNTAYVADFGNRVIDVCAVNPDGSLSGCAAYSNLPANWSPWALTVATAGNGTTYLYATDSNALYGSVQQCSLASDGSISGCAQTAIGTVYGTGIAIGAGYAYIGTFNGSSFIVDVCNYNNDGSISNCTITGSGFSTPSFITINNGFVYVVDEGSEKVSVCTVGTNGSLASCPASALPGGAYHPNSVVFYASQAYVDDSNGNLWLCAVDSGNGALTSCTQGNGGNSFYLSQQLAIH